MRPTLYTATQPLDTPPITCYALGMHLTLHIPDELAGMRLDKALTELATGISRTKLQTAIAAGGVARAEPTHATGCTTTSTPITNPKQAVAAGEIYHVTLPAAPPQDLIPQDIPLDILYEDADLIILNKPAGLSVHPGAGQPSGTLVNGLLHHLGPFQTTTNALRPGIVHRLDQDTSGIMVVAKTPTTHAALADLFQERDITRSYIALCYGAPLPMVGTLTNYLGRHPTHRTKMAVVSPDQPDARHACTHYHVREYFSDQAALIECRLETGRTHQIRVQLAHKNWPIMGDPLYARPRLIKGIAPNVQHQIGQTQRQLLHAQELGFIHPNTGEALHFHTPPPADFQAIHHALQRQFPSKI